MTPEVVYDIDLNETARINIPKRNRGVNMLAFVRLIVAPFTLLYGSFKRFRGATLYDLSITPQVCYLEKFLNDRYDNINRGIYIADGEEHPAIYLYKDAEDRPIDLYRESEDQPVYLFTDGEVDGDLLNDFIVFVPIGVVFSLQEMTSLLRKRLPGMRFKIQLY